MIFDNEASWRDDSTGSVDIDLDTNTQTTASIDHGSSGDGSVSHGGTNELPLTTNIGNDGTDYVEGLFVRAHVSTAFTVTSGADITLTLYQSDDALFQTRNELIGTWVYAQTGTAVDLGQALMDAPMPIVSKRYTHWSIASTSASNPAQIQIRMHTAQQRGVPASA